MGPRAQVAPVSLATCAEAVQEELRDTRAKLLVARNKRQLVEEERRIALLSSPLANAEEAVRCAKLAQECGKLGGASVAEWAAAVATGVSESVARSAPASAIASFSSMATSASRVAEKARLRALPRTAAERAAIRLALLDGEALVRARVGAGRQLSYADFVSGGQFTLSAEQKRQFVAAELGETGSQYGGY